MTLMKCLMKSFWRVIRISAWIMRFLQNCRSKKSNRVSGPLTTAETEKQVKWWIKHGCKKFHATRFHNPPPGNLPVDRTEGSYPFQVVGVDYAGPIVYKASKKLEGKAYIVLFACSLTRAVHLGLLTDQTTEGFTKCLKRFIVRWGRPRKIYSDNGKSFVAASKWLKRIMKDEKTQDYLAHHNILWQFNLSRAPWWGGQFERLVGVVKQAFYKAVGRALLMFDELEEVILNVEVAVNNRPLSYVEDDVEFPVLTPATMMYSQSNLLPEEDADAVENVDLRKRARYVRQCKDVLWSRWTTEYIRSLRERHNLKHKTKDLTLKVGDVVLIQSKECNCGKWNIRIIVKLIKGRDGVVRGVRLRAGKSYLERAIQHLCPMELSCDVREMPPNQPVQLNPWVNVIKIFWDYLKSFVMKLFSCQYESEMCLIIIITTTTKMSILLSLQLQMAIIMDVI